MDFDKFSEQLEAEIAFWNRWRTTKTFDREYHYMKECVPPNDLDMSYVPGDYVKSEDYRRDIEMLENKVSIFKEILLNMRSGEYYDLTVLCDELGL